MNRPLYGNDVAELYRNTKINLNIHIGCHKGFNPRTFEIIAGSNFELCDFRDEADDFGLLDGEHFSLYQDIEDCIRKIDYYLNNDEIRNRIAQNGGVYVRSKFGMTNIIQKFLHDKYPIL